MNNKVVIGIIFAFINIATYGQSDKFELGIEGGPSLISILGDKSTEQSYSPTIGFSGGPFFQYNLNKTFSLRTNIGFERKGFCYETQGIDIISTRTVSIDVDVYYDYLVFPMLIRASFGNNVLLFADAGPYVGYLMKIRTDPRPVANVGLGRIIYTPTDNRIDFGITAGLGIKIPMGQKYAFTLEARNNLGLVNINQTLFLNKQHLRTNATVLLIGLVYKIGDSN